MKKTIILILLAICTVAYAADVVMEITVPDAYVTQVLAAMDTLADTHMTLEARGSSPDPDDDFDGRVDFRIDPKGAGESNLEFAQRFTRELLRASVRVVRSHEENERYRAEISKISPPVVDVNDDVIQ